MLDTCGLSKFKTYAELAGEAGTVEIYLSGSGEEKIPLDPAIRVNVRYI